MSCDNTGKEIMEHQEQKEPKKLGFTVLQIFEGEDVEELAEQVALIEKYIQQKRNEEKKPCHHPHIL